MSTCKNNMYVNFDLKCVINLHVKFVILKNIYIFSKEHLDTNFKIWSWILYFVRFFFVLCFSLLSHTRLVVIGRHLV
jgi:hypothetical protein